MIASSVNQTSTIASLNRPLPFIAVKQRKTYIPRDEFIKLKIVMSLIIIFQTIGVFSFVNANDYGMNQGLHDVMPVFVFYFFL